MLARIYGNMRHILSLLMKFMQSIMVISWFWRIKIYTKNQMKGGTKWKFWKNQSIPKMVGHENLIMLCGMYVYAIAVSNAIIVSKVNKLFAKDWRRCRCVEHEDENWEHCKSASKGSYFGIWVRLPSLSFTYLKLSSYFIRELLNKRRLVSLYNVSNPSAGVSWKHGRKFTNK